MRTRIARLLYRIAAALDPVEQTAPQTLDELIARLG